MIVGNSKSNHFGAQGTFNPSSDFNPETEIIFFGTSSFGVHSQVLLAVDDGEVSVGHDLAHVARAEPADAVDGHEVGLVLGSHL